MVVDVIVSKNLSFVNVSKRFFEMRRLWVFRGCRSRRKLAFIIGNLYLKYIEICAIIASVEVLHFLQIEVDMDNFITIEGCDGVGKTHQTKRLREYCEANGYDNVVFTREPGGSVIAEQIRKIILDANYGEMDDMCEAFLFAASRIQHLHDIVKPALSQGKVVFCDRYVHSSYAYQGVARGLGYEKIVSLNRLAVGEYMPQFTLFLDLSPEKAFLRKGGADKTDRMENADFEFHKKVYEGYMRVIAEHPQDFVVIDASGSADETHSKIIEALRLKGVLK